MIFVKSVLGNANIHLRRESVTVKNISVNIPNVNHIY